MKVSRSFEMCIGDNQLHWGMRVLKELRAAGVPMIGDLFPQSVETGVLQIETDAIDGQIIYTWIP